MIKFENTQVVGWESAIRGMRNPKNSWEKSDSGDGCVHGRCGECGFNSNWCGCTPRLIIGPNDYQLMLNLAKAGSVHAKYRRMIVVYVDITAPLYWWKEFDTYKVGTVANSCSTMHKIHDKEFTLEDFSIERVPDECIRFVSKKTQDMCIPYRIFNTWLRTLNIARDAYLETKDKKYWDTMIQMLPSSYNQKRTVMFNYEVLANIYQYRRNHKLDEWAVGFIDWIKSLPYSELITCTAEKEEKKEEKAKDPFEICLDAIAVIDQLTEGQQEMMIHNLCARINKARGMENG